MIKVNRKNNQIPRKQIIASDNFVISSTALSQL